MPKFDTTGLISEVLTVPVADLVASVGRSIAEAQQALDEQAIESFRQVYASDEEVFRVLRSIGYQPNWYQIPEATAEISIAMTATGDSSSSSPGPAVRGRPRVEVRAAPVDGTYQAKFNYGVQASSSLKFRIVPVPPPVGASALRVAPDVVGMSLADARALLDELGVEHQASAEEGVVTAQEPAPGAVITAGQLVRLTV